MKTLVRLQLVLALFGPGVALAQPPADPPPAPQQPQVPPQAPPQPQAPPAPQPQVPPAPQPQVPPAPQPQVPPAPQPQVPPETPPEELDVPPDTPDPGEPTQPNADQPTDGPSVPRDDDPFTAEHRPTLRVSLPEEEVFTGDVVTLTIRASALAADDLSVPPDQNVSPFEILDANVRVEEAGERATHVFTLELLALEPGEHTLEPIRVRVLTPDGIIGEVETDAITINVRSVLGNEPNAEPKPPTQPVELMEDDPTLYWVGGGLLLVLFTALFTWLFARWWRKRERDAAPPPPPRPAHEIALEKLDSLRGSRNRMLEAGQGVEFVDGVSDAVREYLGHRYGFDGLESTTDEVLSRLNKTVVRGVGMPEISGLLRDCDLVKFAKADFDAEQSELLLSGSYRIVRATMSVDDAESTSPSPAEPARPKVTSARAPASAEGESRWMPPVPSDDPLPGGQDDSPDSPNASAGSSESGASPVTSSAIPQTIPPRNALSSTAPSSTAPSSTAPSSTAPSSTAPSSTAPSSTAPSSTAPSSTAPSSAAPSSAAPSSTAPSSTAPSSAAPSSTAPSSTAPFSTAPSSTAPSSIPQTVPPRNVSPQPLPEGSHASPVGPASPVGADTLRDPGAPTERKIPDTIPPSSPVRKIPDTIPPGSLSAEKERAADTLRGVAFDPPEEEG